MSLVVLFFVRTSHRHKTCTVRGTSCCKTQNTTTTKDHTLPYHTQSVRSRLPYQRRKKRQDHDLQNKEPGNHASRQTNSKQNLSHIKSPAKQRREERRPAHERKPKNKKGRRNTSSRNKKQQKQKAEAASVEAEAAAAAASEAATHQRTIYNKNDDEQQQQQL